MTKCSPGAQRAAIDLLAAEEERIVGVGQPRDLQPAAVPEQAGVAARDLVVPGHGPNAAQPAQHDRLPFRQRPPPALLSFDALGNQVGHGRIRDWGLGIRDWSRTRVDCSRIAALTQRLNHRQRDMRSITQITGSVVIRH